MPRHRRVGTISEDRFHRWARRALPAGRGGLLPLGDDAAAIPLKGREVALLTTDALSEGSHFLARSPPRSIGRAAAAASLSDLAAKGGVPVALLVDLLVPPRTPERWAREVLAGAEEEAARFGAHVVGGDTKPARTRVVVGTAFGRARRDRLAPRTRARPGDLVAVTGAVGRGGLAALGLNGRPTARALRDLLDIRPRVREGPVLARFARAMLDTSDGLAQATRLLAEASRVRVEVRVEDLPLHPALARRLSGEGARLRQALYGGDYELLVTLPPDRLQAARAALRVLGCPFTPVGRIGRGRGAWLVGREGRPARMPPPGWRPFDAAP